MVHILFLPGTFGTTIEYILSQFNLNYSFLRPTFFDEDIILPDGSMHAFYKTAHFGTKQCLKTFLSNRNKETPFFSSSIYPMSDYTAKEIIEQYKIQTSKDKHIFIYIDSVETAEINMLFQYYKISTGLAFQKGMSIFCGLNQNNIINWNQSYTHWGQMRQWELREWFSIFYSEWINEWLSAIDFIDPSWHTISSKNILTEPHETFLKAINYVDEFDSTLENQFIKFVNDWRLKQQYVIDEYNMINQIVHSVIHNITFTWEKINILSESIIQQKLRSAGYEIKCYNLNVFPTNSIELIKLLEPC